MASRTVPRRPLKSRDTRWAMLAATWLIRLHVLPNQISMASVGFAALAGVCFCLVSRAEIGQRVILYLVAAACIQLRLLCNLLDGMVAIEGGLGSAAGELFNDFPDRISDVLILAPAGYSIGSVFWGSELGWVAAILAVLSAYARVLGASLGLGQDFSGPMAKPHRMAVLTAACLAAAIEAMASGGDITFRVALGLIAAGSLVTIVRRTMRIVRQLQSREEKAHVQPSSVGGSR